MNNKLTVAVMIFAAGILTTLGLQHLIFPKPFYVASLPDGSVYDGELLDRKFDGHGTLVWPDGSTFVGEFSEGRFHGKGELNYNKGFVYKGDFKSGDMTGKGSFVYSESESYTGELKNGLMHGKGIHSSYGNKYEGQFVDNRYHGKGKIVYKDGLEYEGEFKEGVIITGTSTIKNGESYEGEFTDWMYHGEGKITYRDGQKYEGEFKAGSIINGIFISRDGTRYEGEFTDWLYHGKGVLKTTSGDKYTGNFSYGSLTGEGEHSKKDGAYYKGGFEYGQYQGYGKLKLNNGDIYEGGFDYGRFNGKGNIEYAKALDGVSKRSGTWKYGKLIESNDGIPIISPKTLNEIALYNQTDLLKSSWSSLKNNNKNQVDLYFLGIAGDGTQAVFRREIQFVKNHFETKLNADGKSLVLINSRDTVKEVPLATTISIKQSVDIISSKMDLNEDILFIYMSSHGSKKAAFSLKQSELSLPDLSADTLAEILDSSSIKWRVIVISACYSGKFIEPLKNENTLIITAAAEDKESFGCSDEAEFTYFGDAYFNQALSQTIDFVEAFDLATVIVEKKEKANKYESSEPQIHKPQPIISQLEKWGRGARSL